MTAIPSALQEPEKFDPQWYLANGNCSEGYIHLVRQAGRSRFRRFQAYLCAKHRKLPVEPDWIYKCSSVCMRAHDLANYHHYEGHDGPYCGTYVDLACGDSPDLELAHRQGYYAYGVDCVHRSVWDEWECTVPRFYKRDITAQLPFFDATVDYCSLNAAIDLIQPEKRPALYREVYRILGTGGTFAITFIRLKRGYGFDFQAERSAMEAAGLQVMNPLPQMGLFLAKLN